jgi:hypothetical protein
MDRRPDGGFGKWAFLEILDSWNTKTEIKKLLDKSDKTD